MLRLASQTRTAHGHVPAAASVSSHAHLRETAGGGCALGRTRHEVSVCSIPRRLPRHICRLETRGVTVGGVGGTLLAIREVSGRVGVTCGLDKLLFPA